MEQIDILENEVESLRKALRTKENELFEIKKKFMPSSESMQQGFKYHPPPFDTMKVELGNKLPRWAIERYSRQILLSDIGVSGQEKLCAAKVLIVGAGGLGCPAALYLAGAGVGHIGIVDYDTVDLTNIHRQILHMEVDQNTSKVVSAAETLKKINSHIKITTHNVQIDSSNALDLVSNYDVVLDCSDNVPTRYLLNDACVLSKLTLISGSALKMEGQITIYGYRAKNNANEKDSAYVGPCYRCLFPTPPPAEAVGSCSANGVAGPVPGVIGCLQALEAIKLLVGHTHKKLLVERMLLFDGEDVTFRTVKLRPKNPQCDACSQNPTIVQLLDYESFCKAKAKEKDLDLHILASANRITATELAKKLSRIRINNSDSNLTQRHLLVDVRSEQEFNMCRIDGAINFPIENLRNEQLDKLVNDIKRYEEVTFVCRRGNDSQIAAKSVIDKIGDEHSSKVTDLTGGLHAWSKDVDNEFPIY